MKDKEIQKKFKWTYSNMKYRCGNKKCPTYKYYGGRGIAVCERWLDFKNFKEDMFESYKNKYIKSVSKGLKVRNGCTLDRIDNNGNYSKDNCVWSSIKQQCNNRRTRSDSYKFNGQLMTLKEIATQSGITFIALRDRLHTLKWPFEKAISTPQRRFNKTKSK